MEKFFSDDELYDILDQLEDVEVEDNEIDEEILASKRRYLDIIKKHKM